MGAEPCIRRNSAPSPGKIVIVGAGGAGKTVLANRLGTLLNIPVVHLDALRYDAGWNLVPEDEFAARQREAVAAHEWITDGNSLATLPLRAAAADTVIVVDPPPLVCLWAFCNAAGATAAASTPMGFSTASPGRSSDT